MHRGALLLNTSLTAEQRALQEQRRGLLRAYRSLLVRIEHVQYDLSAVMLRELTVTKERLESCALDAPDTFRSLFSDLSDFLTEIRKLLDNRDAPSSQSVHVA